MSRKKFQARIPRFAAGIRAQETRSGICRSWWARRWLAEMEGMGMGARLGRGRNYAFSGQVTRLTISGPEVEATVVGSRPDPYQVTMKFRAPTGAAHQRIVDAIKANPMLVARMLADDMPSEVEEFFRIEGFDLFPGGKLAPGVYDMTVKCTCPDWMNPCKHTSAVLYLLGEEISRRPLTLLELRGFVPEEFYDED